MLPGHHRAMVQPLKLVQRSTIAHYIAVNAKSPYFDPKRVVGLTGRFRFWLISRTQHNIFQNFKVNADSPHCQLPLAINPELYLPKTNAWQYLQLSYPLK